MSHVDALLRNKFDAERRLKIERYLNSPLSVISQGYFPASTLPSYKEQDSDLRLRFSIIIGHSQSYPVPCYVYCTDAALGMPGFVPEEETDKKEYLKNHFGVATELAGDIESDLRDLGVHVSRFLFASSTSDYESSLSGKEEQHRPDIYQTGVRVPFYLPCKDEQGNIVTTPNNSQAAQFLDYLVKYNLVNRQEAEQVFSARIKYLANHLNSRPMEMPHP